MLDEIRKYSRHDAVKYSPLVVQLSDARDWVVEGKRYIDACLDQFEQYSPGFKDSIINKHVTNPDDLASRYHVHKGNEEHADVTLAQLGPWRPVPPSRLPDRCGGWPGRNTAHMLLRRSPSERIPGRFGR